MNKYCFGIDIGGTTVKIGLFKTSGTFLEKYEIITRKEENGSYILTDIKECIDRVIIEHSLSKEDISGIGLGVPGSVNRNGIVNKCINLGWDVVPVETVMQDMTGLLVKAGNDANMAALGEYWKGGAAGYSSMAFITLGTGVGGGMIIDGKPVNGFNGAAGEIGHMKVFFEAEELCGCGKKGCLEQVSSAAGIVRRAKKNLASDDLPSSLRQIQTLSAKIIFEEAKKGDILAEKTIEEVCGYLGLALANIAAVADPEIFVIGGGISAAGDFLIRHIEEKYKEYVFHPSKETKIVSAKLGNNAGMYGAAKLIIDSGEDCDQS